jgi:hypothetical protein
MSVPVPVPSALFKVYRKVSTGTCVLDILTETNVRTGTYWYLLVYSYFKEISVLISTCWFILTVKKLPYRYLPVKLFFLKTNVRTNTVPVGLFCTVLVDMR